MPQDGSEGCRHGATVAVAGPFLQTVLVPHRTVSGGRGSASAVSGPRHQRRHVAMRASFVEEAVGGAQRPERTGKRTTTQVDIFPEGASVGYQIDIALVLYGTLRRITCCCC